MIGLVLGGAAEGFQSSLDSALKRSILIDQANEAKLKQKQKQAELENYQKFASEVSALFAPRPSVNPDGTPNNNPIKTPPSYEEVLRLFAKYPQSSEIMNAWHKIIDEYVKSTKTQRFDDALTAYNAFITSGLAGAAPLINDYLANYIRRDLQLSILEGTNGSKSLAITDQQGNVYTVINSPEEFLASLMASTNSEVASFLTKQALDPTQGLAREQSRKAADIVSTNVERVKTETEATKQRVQQGWVGLSIQAQNAATNRAAVESLINERNERIIGMQTKRLIDEQALALRTLLTDKTLSPEQRESAQRQLYILSGKAPEQLFVETDRKYVGLPSGKPLTLFENKALPNTLFALDASNTIQPLDFAVQSHIAKYYLDRGIADIRPIYKTDENGQEVLVGWMSEEVRAKLPRLPKGQGVSPKAFEAAIQPTVEAALADMRARRTPAPPLKLSGDGRLPATVTYEEARKRGLPTTSAAPFAGPKQ